MRGWTTWFCLVMMGYTRLQWATLKHPTRTAAAKKTGGDWLGNVGEVVEMWMNPKSAIRPTFQTISLFQVCLWWVLFICFRVASLSGRICLPQIITALRTVLFISHPDGVINRRWVLFICFQCRVPSGRSLLTSEYHGTAPSACTVLLIVSPRWGD